MRVKIEVGQCWKPTYSCSIYRIHSIECGEVKGRRIENGFEDTAQWFLGVLDQDGYNDGAFYETWEQCFVKLKTIKKVPPIPLDVSLHILEAGHLQDRARKKFK